MKELVVKIGGIPYAVSRIEALSLGPDYSGEIIYADSEIHITSKIRSPYLLRQILYHEILHGVLTALGHQDHDEVLIEGLANQLLSLVQSNPEIFRPVAESEDLI